MKGENLFSEIIIQLSSRHKKCKLYWFRCSCIVILLLCHLFVSKILTGHCRHSGCSVLFAVLTKGDIPKLLRISTTAHEQKLPIHSANERRPFMCWGNQKCNSKCQKMINVAHERCGVSCYRDGWVGAEHTWGLPRYLHKRCKSVFPVHCPAPASSLLHHLSLHSVQTAYWRCTVVVAKASNEGPQEGS